MLSYSRLASSLSSGATRVAIHALAWAAGLAVHAASHATALNVPTGSASFADTALSGTTAAARPELAGTVLEDVLTPFSFKGVSGTVQNRVVRETATGTLDFYWKVNVDGDDTGVGVSALRLSDFAPAQLKDADWRIDGLGTVGASTARLFNTAFYPAGAVNFLMDGVVSAGQASRFIFVHTDAVNYAKTATYDLLTGGAQALSTTYETFAPVAVPEPSSLALLGAGLALTSGVALRRRGRQ